MKTIFWIIIVFIIYVLMNVLNPAFVIFMILVGCPVLLIIAFLIVYKLQKITGKTY